MEGSHPSASGSSRWFDLDSMPVDTCIYVISMLQHLCQFGEAFVLNNKQPL